MPIEERWESVEECEVLFAAASRRFSGEGIALARLNSGLELIMVGQLEQGDYAAWRYADRLRARRMRSSLVSYPADFLAWLSDDYNPLSAAPALAALGLLLAGAPLVGVLVPPAMVLPYRAIRERLKPLVRVRSGEGFTTVRRSQLEDVQWLPGGGARWSLELSFAKRRVKLDGSDAFRTIRPILASLNWRGASQEQVRQAVAKLEHFGGSEGYLDWIAERTQEAGHGNVLGWEQRLAFEMATQEESERRAIQGELAELRAAWAEAEEVAAIADDLLVPTTVREFLARHRRSSDDQPRLR